MTKYYKQNANSKYCFALLLKNYFLYFLKISIVNLEFFPDAIVHATQKLYLVVLKLESFSILILCCLSILFSLRRFLFPVTPKSCISFPPSAALDARGEYEVFQRFADLKKGKLAVLISHRFSTVHMTDRKLVLEKGQLIELGSHKELLEEDGRYTELFNLQAMGYPVARPKERSQ